MTKKNETIIKRFMRKSGFDWMNGYNVIPYNGKEYKIIFGGHFIIATTEDLSDDFKNLGLHYDIEYHVRTMKNFLDKFAGHDDYFNRKYDFSEIVIDSESVKTRKDANKANKSDLSWIYRCASGEDVALNVNYLSDAMTLTKSTSMYVNMDEWKSGQPYKSGVYFENEDKSTVMMILPRIPDGFHYDEDGSYNPFMVNVFAEETA